MKTNIEILKFYKDNPIPGFGFMKDSPYLLGLLPENYSEQEHKNKRHKVRNLIRQELIEVSKKLNLSVPLQLKSARDCFATTLFRAGVSLE
ncbi:MAG: hypothetical protein NTV01_09560, partial [Bacteroidia bacterium]|nr:hypothetical protein [Bacteroidia bacterium]